MTKQTLKKGFTLIELLVVIAIIGILSSVVLVSLNSSRQKARDSKRVADLGQLQTALALYMDENGSYPGSVSVSTIGSYMANIPVDPSSSSAYGYDQLSSGASYHLCATLEQAGSANLDSDNDSATVGANCASVTDPIYNVTP